MVVDLAAAAPREARDLVVANPGLLDNDTDDAIAELLVTARRQGDGPRAERLERGRRILQRHREYGAERVLVRDVLDRIESLDPTELADALAVVSGEDLQAELRRRIDGATETGDVLAWRRWVHVSIALELAAEGTPLSVVVPDDVERDVAWAQRFLAERDVDAQRAMLRDGPTPLPQSRLDQVNRQFQIEHLIAGRERDALRVIHLRRSIAMASVVAGDDPELTEDVLSGRRDVIVTGPTP